MNKLYQTIKDYKETKNVRELDGLHYPHAVFTHKGTDYISSRTICPDNDPVKVHLYSPKGIYNIPDGYHLLSNQTQRELQEAYKPTQNVRTLSEKKLYNLCELANAKHEATVKAIQEKREKLSATIEQARNLQHVEGVEYKETEHNGNMLIKAKRNGLEYTLSQDDGYINHTIEVSRTIEASPDAFVNLTN